MHIHVITLISQKPVVGIQVKRFQLYQKTFQLQRRSQDLNRPVQDIAQNFDHDVIIMTLTSL